MHRNTGGESRNRQTRSSRRAVLRRAGTGLLVGSALGGVAAGKPDRSTGRDEANANEEKGKSKTAGRPRIVVSTPECETLRIEYVRGNPPVQVFVDGPEPSRISLDDETRSVVWTVEPGEYEVTAKPGNDGSKGNPAVVVDGSPVTVETCARPLDATFQCTADGGIPRGQYTLSNPRDEDVTVDIVLSTDDRSFERQYTVPAESTITVPPGSEFVADGTWTHEFSATLTDEGTTVAVNGESPWTNTPDCS
ncbi:hypothetical protein [Salinigranum sp. GCM10025319]|uniref:hypothetical protein n=1 Tax=Salinigranum sp. GCM10025319 TaxID=3252687 RepID=UPI00360C492B